MIDRYSLPEMQRIFGQEHKYKIWLLIETYAAEKMAALGLVPESVALALKSIDQLDHKKIDKLEQELKHDVIAFLTAIADEIGDDARFVHKGLTSSDILDTGLALQLKQATELLQEKLDKVLTALKTKALRYKHTLTIGRSHGMFAEPVSFGFKLLGHYAAFARAKKRLQLAVDEIAVCKLRGAVGTYAHVAPAVEQYVAEQLGLKLEQHATQIIPRDRHAMFMSYLAVLAGNIENLVLEIRHLQRSEVQEAEEFFAEKQKGSSAMPHKKNPILSENLTGLARLVRGYLMPALEDITLWHERDISHSSVERVILPDALVVLHFALSRLAQLIETLVVLEFNMAENLQKTFGIHHSGRLLLALTAKGVSREQGYYLVQRLSQQAFQTKTQLQQLIEQDQELKQYLTSAEIAELCDNQYHLKEMDRIFDAVLKA